MSTANCQQTEAVSPNQEAQASLLRADNIRALTQTLTKKETLDSKVEQALQKIAVDILDEVVDLGCRLANHRGSRTLHRNDLRVAFEKRLKHRVALRRSDGTGGFDL